MRSRYICSASWAGWVFQYGGCWPQKPRRWINLRLLPSGCGRQRLTYWLSRIQLSCSSLPAITALTSLVSLVTSASLFDAFVLRVVTSSSLDLALPSASVIERAETEL